MPSTLPPPEAPPLPPFPGSILDARGFRLHIRRSANPAAPGTQPAVYVHGLGGSSTNWTDLMALLGDRLDGFAPDLPGHGRSPASPTGRYRLSVHVQAVEALIDSLGCGPVHLIGNSLGGAVSTYVAARRPDLVRSLSLVSPAFPQLDPRRAKETGMGALLIPGAARIAGRLLERVPIEKRTQAVLDLCYAEPSRVHPQRLAEEVEEARARALEPFTQAAFIASARGLITSYLATGQRSLWASAGQVTAPVQLIWGAQDKLVPVALAPRVRAAFRRAPGGAGLEIFPDAGHVAMMEKPIETAEIIRQFLDAPAARA